MSCALKEMFYSLQGEGRHAGRSAVFCRFAGCNLWSGREADHTTTCDTDFVGTDGLGGEPLLQVDDALVFSTMPISRSLWEPTADSPSKCQSTG
jgi:hypothetical protein